jgi:DNA-binding NarL/FixJ family response regulator
MSDQETRTVVDLIAARTVRILLVDPHSLFRQAMHEVLEHEDDMEVVGEGGTGAQMLSEAYRKRPDVVLMSAELLDGPQGNLIQRVNERLPHCRVLVLSNDEDDQSLLRAVESGANGFLTKACALSDLMSAARAVARGETLVPPRMLGGLLEHLIRRRNHQEDAVRRLSHLTRRERQVLALLAEGANKDAIARRLLISPETARTHIQHVLEKLDVHSRLEAAAVAMQGGLVHELLEAGS